MKEDEGNNEKRKTIYNVGKLMKAYMRDDDKYGGLPTKILWHESI